MNKILDQSLKLSNIALGFDQVAANNGVEIPEIDGKIINDMNLNKLEKYHQKYVYHQDNPKSVKIS
ncbi:MAG: hypothetical protein Q8807_01030 ['Waltheria sp.' little leaf phytoplasma]|nr:hypothetical protein ['Waltheria sp.' little leaf phytoplasma]